MIDYADFMGDEINRLEAELAAKDARLKEEVEKLELIDHFANSSLWDAPEHEEAIYMIRNILAAYREAKDGQ
jgi:hypothetical protein